MGEGVEELVRSVPGWADAELTITPITTGMTNRNFRVDVAGASYVVRIPGERTALLGIDRAGEAEMATRAAALGIERDDPRAARDHPQPVRGHPSGEDRDDREPDGEVAEPTELAVELLGVAELVQLRPIGFDGAV